MHFVVYNFRYMLNITFDVKILCHAVHLIKSLLAPVVHHLKRNLRKIKTKTTIMHPILKSHHQNHPPRN